jgi:hypothetical protein
MLKSYSMTKGCGPIVDYLADWDNLCNREDHHKDQQLPQMAAPQKQVTLHRLEMCDCPDVGLNKAAVPPLYLWAMGFQSCC